LNDLLLVLHCALRLTQFSEPRSPPQRQAEKKVLVLPAWRQFRGSLAFRFIKIADGVLRAMKLKVRLAYRHKVTIWLA
jgi:hypothetical protein